MSPLSPPGDRPPSAAQPGPKTPTSGDGRFDPLVGEALGGRYKVLRRIGEGGMGAVYEAEHKVIGKRVAIKVLLERFGEKQDLVKRLLNEARLASAIGHENIVDVTDFGTTDDGRAYVVMEYLEGEPLSELLAREAPLAVSRCLGIVRQVAGALSAAHDKGIIHRDIKPENVYLIKRGNRDFVKVVDFGVSKAVHSGEEGAEALRLTRTGTLMGTPLYMSPEQARGDEDVDSRADVWAVGVLLFECLTGEVPFRARNYLQVISQVLNHEVVRPSQVQPNLGLPEAVEQVVMRALAKDRKERYQRMQDFRSDLDRLALGDELASVDLGAAGAEPTEAVVVAARPRWRFTAAMVSAIGLAATLAVMQDEEAPLQPAGSANSEQAAPARFEPPTRPAAVPVNGGPDVPNALPTKVARQGQSHQADTVPSLGAPASEVSGAPTRDSRSEAGSAAERRSKRNDKRRATRVGTRRRIRANPAPALGDATTQKKARPTQGGEDGVLRIGDDVVPAPGRLYPNRSAADLARPKVERRKAEP